MILPGLYKKLIADPGVSAILATPADSLFINVAVKQSARPYLVMNLVDGRPAEATQDGSSELIDGEFQFDAYADDPTTARKLSRAVRDSLKNYSGALPEGTVIQFVEVTMDHDEPYELGGGGYIFRSLLRLKAFYTEAAS
jgi:uncharacterized protein DUF3168